MSSIGSVRPSAIGAPHRHVGPDLEDESRPSIRIPRQPARLEGLVRALTIGSGLMVTAGLLAAQVLGTGG